MAKIEIDMKEYQGMRNKIKNLESALNSISTEAAQNKERVEKAKALVIDLTKESFFRRLFNWSLVLEPLKEMFDTDGKIQKERKA